MKKKLLGFMLVMVTIFSIFYTSTQPVSAAPTCYQQGDSRWGGIYYGKWNLAESGCGILSMVNAVNYLTGNFMHPTELAAWGYNNKSYNGIYGQGTVRAMLYADVTAAFGKKYGFKVTNLTYGTVTNATLINHLSNGGAAVVHVPNHFMALCGYNTATGQYLVYDSAAAPKRNTSVYGSWLTAAQLNANSLTKIDWFCLVSKNGTGTVSNNNNTGSNTNTNATATYKVTASVAAGQGSVHFGNNITSATVKAGTTINYQTTPASGYKVSKILVGGTAQTIKNNGGDAVYQFTMPKGNCGVVVTFTKTTAATPSNVYKVSASVAGGSGTVHFGNGITSANVAPGTLINYQTTPASGYKVSKILVGGTAQAIKNNGGDAVYQFTMPKGDCGVVVTFSKVQTAVQTYTVSASVTSGYGSVHFGNNVKSAKVAAGTVINFQTTPSAGYKVSEILIDGTVCKVRNNGGDCVYQFTMPAEDCKVAVTFKKVATSSKAYQVTTKVAGGSGTVHFGKNVKTTKVAAGTVVNFQATPAAGYKISKIVIGGTTWTIKDNGADAVYQFVMPAKDCTVSVTFSKITVSSKAYTVSAAVIGGSGSVHFGKNVTSAKVAAGTIVNFQATPASGYRVSQILVGGKAWTVVNNGKDAVYQFAMPAKACKVEVIFAKASTTYTVKCGTFGVQSNAISYANKIAAKGFQVSVVKINNSYVVCVGTYTSTASANKYVSKLKAAGYDAYVSKL